MKTPAVAMQQVYSLTKEMYFGALAAHEAALELRRLRDEATARRSAASGGASQSLEAFITKAAALEGAPPSPGGGRGGRGLPAGATGPQAGGPPAAAVPQDTLWALRASLSGLMNSMQAADVAPTAATLAAVTAAQANAARVMARWRAFKAVEVPAIRGR